MCTLTNAIVALLETHSSASGFPYKFQTFPQSSVAVSPALVTDYRAGY